MFINLILLLFDIFSSLGLILIQGVYHWAKKLTNIGDFLLSITTNSSNESFSEKLIIMNILNIYILIL